MKSNQMNLNRIFQESITRLSNSHGWSLEMSQIMMYHLIRIKLALRLNLKIKRFSAICMFLILLQNLRWRWRELLKWNKSLENMRLGTILYSPLFECTIDSSLRLWKLWKLLTFWLCQSSLNLWWISTHLKRLKSQEE